MIGPPGAGTLLLAEPHIPVVVQVSDRVGVLDHGEPIAEWPPEARRGPTVIAASPGEPA